LQPLFFVEILFRLSPADVDLKTLGDRTSDTYDVITSKVPVLRSLPCGTFTELQQAAAFEYVFDYVSNRQNALTQSGSYIWENFRQLQKRATKQNCQSTTATFDIQRHFFSGIPKQSKRKDWS
jgi:hypothetical protein